MRRMLSAALAAGLFAMPARSQEAPAATAAAPPAAALPATQPCGARAARYEGGNGFGMVVTRLGRASADNPLRPLTPEVTQVVQVMIGLKPATAYGPDLAALRRGPAPGALEAQLGAPIRWEAALPELPDPLAIVAEDGAPLAALAFRDCTDPPAVKAPPAAAARGGGKGAGKGDGKAGGNGDAKGEVRPPRRAAPAADAPKAPPGFRLPQGAIAE